MLKKDLVRQFEEAYFYFLSGKWKNWLVQTGKRNFDMCVAYENVREVSSKHGRGLCKYKSNKVIHGYKVSINKSKLAIRSLFLIM